MPDARIPTKTVTEKRSEIMRLSPLAVIFLDRWKVESLHPAPSQPTSVVVSFAAGSRCLQQRPRLGHLMQSPKPRGPALLFASCWRLRGVLQIESRLVSTRSDVADRTK